MESGRAAPDALREPASREAEARRRLRALEASFKGRIGAYALDTATGKTVTHRSGERFPLLSTFKAVARRRRAAQGPYVGPGADGQGRALDGRAS